jgi:hypothetical protein
LRSALDARSATAADFPDWALACSRATPPFSPLVVCAYAWTSLVSCRIWLEI